MIVAEEVAWVAARNRNIMARVSGLIKPYQMGIVLGMRPSASWLVDLAQSYDALSLRSVR